MFDFKTDLARGDLGEKIFLEKYKNLTKIPKNFDCDFITESGKKIELKTDFYNMSKTSNFFMERYSNYSTKRVGGVWQSVNNGADFYIYFFIKNRTYFKFNPIILKSYLENNTYPEIFIQNNGYKTMGFKVDRDKIVSDLQPKIIKI